MFEKKANKVEKMKATKDGCSAWENVTQLGELIRAGETKWEDLDLDDVDLRLKWAGLFHRRKRAPGTFMMRLKVCCTHSAQALECTCCAKTNHYGDGV